LLRAGFEPEEVASAIESLEAVGLVDDERFAAQVAEQATRGRLSGRRAVLGSLLGKGVARQLAERTAESLAPTEEARAEELAARQAPRMRDLDPAVAFRRLSSLLIRRGFEPGVSFEVSRRVLGEPSEDG
jgi:regulatory protein